MNKCGKPSALWYACMPNVKCTKRMLLSGYLTLGALATRYAPPAELQTDKAVFNFLDAGSERRKKKKLFSSKYSALVLRWIGGVLRSNEQAIVC